MRYTVKETRPVPASRVRYTSLEPSQGPRWGLLSAIDTQASGAIKWQVRTEQPLVGGVLATAGDLLFMGEGNGRFNAYDAHTGKLLWQHECSAGVNAPPITYEIDGRQYVAVAAGGNQLFGFKQGETIHVFALPE